MHRTLACTSLLVDDIDTAIRYFTEVLHFELLEDTPIGNGRRWVRVAPSGEGGVLLLARASTPEQQALVGRQWGGRVGLFLHTSDFDADHARMSAGGVHFRETPRHEAYGRVAVFEDRWGNLWDLIGPRP
jgi:catechol 2,3-dioxygenase-like lactoylglutathione lyase family enzyme